MIEPRDVATLALWTAEDCAWGRPPDVELPEGEALWCDGRALLRVALPSWMPEEYHEFATGRIGKGLAAVKLKGTWPPARGVLLTRSERLAGKPDPIVCLSDREGHFRVAIAMRYAALALEACVSRGDFAFSLMWRGTGAEEVVSLWHGSVPLAAIMPVAPHEDDTEPFGLPMTAQRFEDWRQYEIDLLTDEDSR